MLPQDTLADALHTAGARLHHRAAPTGLVSGGARALLGLVERSTRDLDVVARIDLLALRPTAGELGEAAAWCRSHDPSVAFDEVQLRPVLQHVQASASVGADV